MPDPLIPSVRLSLPLTQRSVCRDSDALGCSQPLLASFSCLKTTPALEKISFLTEVELLGTGDIPGSALEKSPSPQEQSPEGPGTSLALHKPCTRVIPVPAPAGTGQIWSCFLEWLWGNGSKSSFIRVGSGPGSLLPSRLGRVMTKSLKGITELVHCRGRVAGGHGRE